MALSKKAKLGIAAVAGLALFGFGGAALADDDDDDDDDGPPPPPPPEDDPTNDDPPDDLPPPPPTCNYSGCGPAFDNAHQQPAYYALRIQQLGYPINVAIVAANGSTLAVQPQRGYVALFQGHFNSVRQHANGFPPTIAAKLAAIRDSDKLGVDGLNGNRTINAVNLAHAAVISTGISWENLVRMVEGS